MLRSRMRAGTLVIVVGAAMTLAPFAASGRPLGPPPPVFSVAPPYPALSPFPVVTGCRTEPRLFHSLKTGWVDYCRGHLGYAPGALDCFNFADEVCTVFSPATREWTESRLENPPVVFPCPDVPEPPTCPRLGP